jgi:TIR domain
MQTSIVFISHVTSEKELAIAFKNLIEKSFLKIIDVFVSSDGESIEAGDKWLDRITTNLRDCAVELIFCSPASLKRPWINFEAGAGWVRGIPVIPICHSGSEPSTLPIPINMCQGVRADDEAGLKSVFQKLAKAVGCECPNVDFSDFIRLARVVAEAEAFWGPCNAAFRAMRDVDFAPDHCLAKSLDGLRDGSQFAQCDLTDAQRDTCARACAFLEKHQVLKFTKLPSTKFADSGIYYVVRFDRMSNFVNVLSDPRCKY